MNIDPLYAMETLLPFKRLRRMVFSVTARCNSRCKTCFIWKKDLKDQLTLADIEKFARSKALKKVRFLVLTGGETFLRTDIDKIVNVLKKKNHKLHITILTNGLLPELIKKKVQQMPRDVLITLSFNGKEKTHDETRGVPGNYKKLLKTIEYMKELKQDTNLIYTITPENYDQISWAWEFAKKHDLNILFNPEVEYARLDTDNTRKLSEEQKEKVLEQLREIYKERKRGFFDQTYYLFFEKFYSGRTVTNKCYAGTNSYFIDYTGDVYPCENLVGIMPPLANIKEISLKQIDYTKEIKKNKCYENCYLLCEMVPNSRKHLLKTYLNRNK